ncbi:MAG TPA: response regulator transcription factor [Trueperaceae bacterium]
MADAPKTTLLVIEDDPGILESLELGLGFEGFHVLTATSGSAGLRLLRENDVAVLILDILLPGSDGYSILREIRQSAAPYRAIPVLMLTALDEIEHRVRGLEAGADDYLIKPFALAELVARIEAILRRQKREEARAYSDVSLYPERFEARRGTRVLGLTPKEYLLLQAFVDHAERLLSKDTLMRLVWQEEVDPNTLEVHISSLRRALGSPPLIHTVRGYGYLLEDRNP